jgi:chromate transporter
LILNAVIKLWKAAVIDRITVVIFAVVFLGSVFLNLSPVIYVVLAAVAGIVLQVKKIPDKQADGQ